MHAETLRKDEAADEFEAECGGEVALDESRSSGELRIRFLAVGEMGRVVIWAGWSST